VGIGWNKYSFRQIVAVFSIISNGYLWNPAFMTRNFSGAARNIFE
jgi:hypothetical protein